MKINGNIEMKNENKTNKKRRRKKKQSINLKLFPMDNEAWKKSIHFFI